MSNPGSHASKAPAAAGLIPVTFDNFAHAIEAFEARRRTEAAWMPGIS